MDVKQNVLIVHNYYQIPGGEDVVVKNEKHLLEKHGHKVITYERHNSELKNMPKVRKILLLFSSIFSIKTYGDVKKIIKEQKINVVHVHNTIHLISPSVYYAAVKCGIPIVQTVHNFRLMCPGATFFRNDQVCEACVKNGLGNAIKYKCYRNSRIETMICVIGNLFHRLMGIYRKIYYICLTDFNKNKLLQLRQIKPQNVFVKPNYSEKMDFPVLKYAERKSQILYAGRFDETKGMDVLLKAWKLLGQQAPQLVLCGTGPLESVVKEYIEKEKLEKVIMKGFLPNEEIKKLMSESKALVLPTKWYEGFPMTMVEAFSVGTPVIGTDLGNVGSLIENGKTGWKFVLNSAESLADCVLNIHDIVDDVYETFQKKYTEEKNYMQLKAIYDHVNEIKE